MLGREFGKSSRFDRSLLLAMNACVRSFIYFTPMYAALLSTFTESKLQPRTKHLFSFTVHGGDHEVSSSEELAMFFFRQKKRSSNTQCANGANAVNATMSTTKGVSLADTDDVVPDEPPFEPPEYSEESSSRQPKVDSGVDSPWRSDPFLLALQSGFEDRGRLGTLATIEDEEEFADTADDEDNESASKQASKAPAEPPTHAYKPTVLFAEEVDIIETPTHPECFTVNEEQDVEKGLVSAASKTTKQRPLADKNAVTFGIRLSFVLTTSSLFVLAQSPESQSYPQGVWVYISALMVSWFPTMDVASVAEKTFQRVLGTVIGACLAIACGFLSLLMPSFVWQGIFIGCCIMLLSFFFSFAMVQYKPLFGKYSYACLLCLLTFGIAILPFYTDKYPQYEAGLYRVANVIIGCGIGTVGALICWPRSTRTMLRDKIQAQVKLAGEASEAVLVFASETFAKRMKNETQSALVSAAALSVRRSLGKSLPPQDAEDHVNDAAHEKYNKAIGEWKAVTSVFPLAKYDPFNLCRDTKAYEAYREEVSMTLARALRIQTTVVLLDGIIRNDRGGRCTDSQLHLFQEIGRLIKTMLTPPYNAVVSQVAAEDLLDCLEHLRQGVVEESVAVADAAPMHRRLFCGSVHKEDFKFMLERRDQGMPLCVHSRDNCSLLFLQLVEHLVIRSLRLYYMWRQVEE